MMLIQSLHRNIKIRLAVGFLFGIAQSTTLPFMAIYFAHRVGEALAGVLLTGATVASLAGGLVGGYYCDKIGRRKLMILGETVFFISYTVMAAANSPWWHSAWMTFAMYLIGNICWGVYGSADEAMLLDITTPETRPAVYGMFYWLNNLTLAIGSSMGAFLFENHRFLLFGITGGTVLITLVTTCIWIRETRPADLRKRQVETKAPSMVRVYHQVFTDKTFVLYLVGGVFVAFLEFQLNNYIGIHLAKHMTQATIAWFGAFTFHLDGIKMEGFLQTENTILVVLLATLAIRFVTGRAQRPVLIWGLLANATGYVLMTIVTAPAALVVVMLLATVGEVVNVPVRQAYLGTLAPESLRSSYVAANGMGYGAARMLASLAVLLGALVPDWAMTAVSAGVGAIGIGCLWMVATRLAPDTAVTASDFSA